MSDFSVFKIYGTHSWVISDPKRGERPHDEKEKECPFCHKSVDERIIYRSGVGANEVRVLHNKYPFARYHEVVIHTKEHVDKLFDLSQENISEAIRVWKNRFDAYKDNGTVCIFSNSGDEAGESVAHSHSQVAVLPEQIELDIPRLEDEYEVDEKMPLGVFDLVCPSYTQWPDEVWIVPQKRGRFFYDIESEEVSPLGYILKRTLFLLSLRHGDEFPYNFIVYPFRDWYLRIIPRAKAIGGLEVGTGVMVNTGTGAETVEFLRDHFYEEDEGLIRSKKALYRRTI